MIDAITQRLFAQVPDKTLYHYTSLSGLMGIVESGALRASDVRYMNDSAELRHTLSLLQKHITERINSGADDPVLLNKLLEWLSHRIANGPMLFGASFRVNGNLLSQWRGYSNHSKGVSLGFNPEHVHECARRQAFQVAACQYDSAFQAALIEQIVDGVEVLAAARPQSESDDGWAPVFEEIEGDLLRIAALLKHPSFEEEQEWRIVSPLITPTRGMPVHFREGDAMLVPYYLFELTARESGGIDLDHVFIGPSANINLSTNSVALFLTKLQAEPRRGISYCQIPYRKR
ncbi:DUF2971 domain-containing protein [Congregibacter sp.]|uniref:DUF2971 domain-containing protein n=1 Tax=Congregibacter sp. TaxID=2744308 RepID=UPI003F6D35D6